MQAVRTTGAVDLVTQEGCAPNAPMPSWWSGFLFHVLNPRQVCMYVYLTMLVNDHGSCHPTIDEIREDLGLYSTTMVFEALTVLEDLGFITRERQSFPGVRAKRNVYRRTACEYTLLRLLQTGRIDGLLCPRGINGSPAAPEAKALVVEGLRLLLEDQFDIYQKAPPEAKRDVLIEILDSAIKTRPGGIIQ